MPDAKKEVASGESEAPNRFLLAEYESLTKIEISRNERLDRFITLFMTVAGTPFAVYSLTLGKDGRADLLSMPDLIASFFLLASILGALVVMIIAQIRFNIILYVRAANAIRGYLSAQTELENALLLPKSWGVPHYYEKGNHTYHTIIAMALVNSLYMGLAAYNLLHLSNEKTGLSMAALPALLFFYFHLTYYRKAAERRERLDRGPGRLHFAEQEAPRSNSELERERVTKS